MATDKLFGIADYSLWNPNTELTSGRPLTLEMLLDAAEIASRRGGLDSMDLEQMFALNGWECDE